MNIEQIILIIFYLATLLFSIILHEVSHGVMAMLLGDHTARLRGRLSLDPFKHIDPIGTVFLPLIMFFTTGFVFGWAKPVPYNPYALRGGKWGEVLVAFAGPVTNFMLALLASILGMLIPLINKVDIFTYLLLNKWDQVVNLVAGNPMAIIFSVCVMFIYWNVLLGVFNLIPIPPLDGSKLLFYFVDIDLKTRMLLETWGFFIVIIVLRIPFFATIFSAFLWFFWSVFFNIATIF